MARVTEAASGEKTGQLPSYTIAGLFESGTLDLEAESALEEIRSLQSGFKVWLNPQRGWMSPRYGDSRPAVPRQLGQTDWWERYSAWRRRWGRRVLPPSPEWPWGLSVAALVIALATTPLSFADAACMLGWSEIGVVRLFVLALDDYWKEQPFQPALHSRLS
jgi:hypothetical protein